MHWEVTLNDTALFKVVKVDVLLQCLEYNGLMLARVKLVEIIGSEAFERLYAVSF